MVTLKIYSPNGITANNLIALVPGNGYQIALKNYPDMNLNMFDYSSGKLSNPYSEGISDLEFQLKLGNQKLFLDSDLLLVNLPTLKPLN